MDDSVNAFIERFTLEGAADGPLAGMTFGAKDLFDVAGHVTGYGNPEWARTRGKAEGHAAAVETLLDAGATLVGKTHTDELAYSLMGANAHYGTPVNTADPRRVPGGSSSGSAAATAAGLVEVGLGSDTGGSVRLPASFCGLWGIRTSFGLLPLDGAMPFTHSFDTVGWFARDVQTMLRVSEAFGCPGGPAVTQLLLPVDAWARVDAATIAAVGPTLQRLQEALGPVRPVLLAPEGLDAWRETFRICQAGEIWQCLGDWVAQHTPEFGQGTRERFELAATIDAESFEAASAEKARIQDALAALLEPTTSLVLPTSPGAAPLRAASAAELDEFRRRAFDILCPAGLGGLPQLSMPAGEVEGAPVGLSLVGAAGQDLELVRLAIRADLRAE